jgi:hypothetical protein
MLDITVATFEEKKPDNNKKKQQFNFTIESLQMKKGHFFYSDSSRQIQLNGGACREAPGLCCSAVRRRLRHCGCRSGHCRHFPAYTYIVSTPSTVSSKVTQSRQGPATHGHIHSFVKRLMRMRGQVENIWFGNIAVYVTNKHMNGTK